LNDSLRNGEPTRSISHDVNGNHPLQSRLEKWNETQLEFKLDGYGRTFGVAEPIRRTMELEIVKNQLAPTVFGSNNIHRDILENKDTTVEWEDVYRDEVPASFNFHHELEKQMKI
jgi:proteasome maturation protein